MTRIQANLFRQVCDTIATDCSVQVEIDQKIDGEEYSVRFEIEYEGLTHWEDGFTRAINLLGTSL